MIANGDEPALGRDQPLPFLMFSFWTNRQGAPVFSAGGVMPAK